MEVTKYKGFKVGDTCTTLADYKECKIAPTIQKGTVCTIKGFPATAYTIKGKKMPQHFVLLSPVNNPNHYVRLFTNEIELQKNN